MTYEEKIKAKIEYARNKASELKASSDKFFSKGFCETTGIPMGQPILVGHHSERRHRNTIKKYENRMRKEIENSDKANFYEERVKRLENNTIISSDDPKAITKLKEKVEKLEKQRSKIKAINSAYRKHKKGNSKELKKFLSDEEIIKLEDKIKDNYSWEKNPYPNHVLTNLGSTIRAVKKRIDHLQKQNNIEETEETINGIILKTDKEDNRVRLFFDGKPTEELRTKLKRNGFRWSPYNGCWQKQLNEWSIQLAREIVQEV